MQFLSSEFIIHELSKNMQENQELVPNGLELQHIPQFKSLIESKEGKFPPGMEEEQRERVWLVFLKSPYPTCKRINGMRTRRISKI